MTSFSITQRLFRFVFNIWCRLSKRLAGSRLKLLIIALLFEIISLEIYEWMLEFNEMFNILMICHRVAMLSARRLTFCFLSSHRMFTLFTRRFPTHAIRFHCLLSERWRKSINDDYVRVTKTFTVSDLINFFCFLQMTKILRGTFRWLFSYMASHSSGIRVIRTTAQFSQATVGWLW